jgi:hypothetical protein
MRAGAGRGLFKDGAGAALNVLIGCGQVLDAASTKTVLVRAGATASVSFVVQVRK